MNMVKILFYVFIFIAGSSAVAIVFSRNVFNSALYLLVTLLAVAALYVLSFAEFLAVTQILIYAGGILVIIIFGIMLTTRISGRPLVVEHAHIFGGGLAAISLLAILFLYLPSITTSNQEAMSPESIRSTGLLLFSVYTLPFEIAGILLLVALIGASVISSNLKPKV
jgi:NADH:ubiquinone oxidoreductase subunit 6 (subunit J)